MIIFILDIDFVLKAFVLCSKFKENKDPLHEFSS
jgi:hypothetical protein